MRIENGKWVAGRQVDGSGDWRAERRERIARQTLAGGQEHPPAARPDRRGGGVPKAFSTDDQNHPAVESVP